MSRFTLVLIAAALATISETSAVSAQRPAPAMAFTGSASNPISTAVRTTVTGFARKRGLGLYDLADAVPHETTRIEPLATAVADYEAFRYDQAIAKLDSLEQEAISTGGAGFTRRQLTDLFIYRAMSKSEAGSAAAARDDLIRAASLFPTYRLDEARFRPSLRAAFERARKDVLNTPKSTITIEAPTGCVTFFDGQRQTASVPSETRFGSHFVHARCAGFQPHAGTLIVDAAAQTFKLDLTPTPDPRTVALAANSSSPSLIWIDASSTTPGRVTIELIDMATGKSDREWSVTVENPKSASSVEDILVSLIDTEFSAPTPAAPPAITIIKEPPTRWYQRKWLWVVVGAAAASAIIVPFALRDGTETSFGASVEGLP